MIGFCLKIILSVNNILIQDFDRTLSLPIHTLRYEGFTHHYRLETLSKGSAEY